MTNNNEGTKHVLFWGDTQVGKTALIATSLSYERENFPEIDWQRSADALAASVTPHWRRLKLNQWVAPTSKSFSEAELWLKSGERLVLVDIRGGIVRNVHDEEARNQIKKADAILFLVEWNGQNMPQHFAAIDAVWPTVQHLPKGLVFTKCERSLLFEDEEWKSQPGWWHREESLIHHRRVLAQFPQDAIWPVSVYGYNETTLAPAVILGEFGQLLPYNVNPRNVAEPLRWILNQLSS